jgi:hypothetical protein
VEFHLADIAGNFYAVEAQFRSKIETVWLGMNCRGNGDFIGAQFFGSAPFAKSTFLDLVVGYTNPDAAPVAQLDLSRSSVKRQLLIEKIRIRDLDARWLRAEGSTDFVDLICGAFGRSKQCRLRHA